MYENSLKTIYLAGGCFWGIEAYMAKLKGIVKTRVGYANGIIPNPSYEEVCNLDSGHAETVEVIYNPEIISLKKILEEFFKIIDPTLINQQGNDVGHQYRTGIYYIEDENQNNKENSKNDLDIIKEIFKQEQKKQEKYNKIVVTELEPISSFYVAEDYHQDYLEKNPGGYCHIDLSLIPEDLLEIENVTTELVDDYDFYDCCYEHLSPDEKENRLKDLTPLQYEVTQNNSTEVAGTGKYNDFSQEGIYVDIVSGEPLFTSLDKFDSGCGWPSFTKPLNNEHIIENRDISHGMIRTEIKSKIAKSHLGHVFDDGPSDKTGKRYCVNSASLSFIPVSELEKKGYGKYISLFNR